MEVEIEKNNNKYSVETAVQTGMELNERTISLPIERCTRSHRYLKIL